MSTSENPAPEVGLPVPLACAESSNFPLPSEDHRSSGNFSTSFHPDGSTNLKFEAPVGVTFTVKSDRIIDREVWTGVRNGTVVEFESHDELYIADPEGASESFLVKLWVS